MNSLIEKVTKSIGKNYEKSNWILSFISFYHKYLLYSTHKGPKELHIIHL